MDLFGFIEYRCVVGSLAYGLALKANPNVLECLYSPMVEYAGPVALELLAIRHAFLSRRVYVTYREYVMAQFRKLDGDRRSHRGIRWKHAMHLIRLLLAGIAVLRDGFLTVDAGEHRERLLAIRRGDLPWEDVDAWRLDLHRQLDAVAAQTPLPAEPDLERADAFLIRARRAALNR